LEITGKLLDVLLGEPTVLVEMDVIIAALPVGVDLTRMEETALMVRADYPSSMEVTEEINPLKLHALVASVGAVEPMEILVVVVVVVATPVVLEVTTPETMAVVEVVDPTILEPTKST
jgi:hypothetical protein